ncbi:hypothetical protein M422DRAFT_276140 [Sphaerobolus stellatus SS14]|uniref:Berberine/berberine-like domain-containing protein n=1 Tax=Sphaerobolus stellatus (strain SS14) TaxID=990650 RepID=A0A0C9TN59_SPHS4|nr:hypothetical protein M422DRAFT_276140 [Sphaerobolus stellatus SS14]
MNRQASHVVPVIGYTKTIVQTMVDQVQELATLGFTTAPTDFTMFTLEPLHKDLYDAATNSAYPHTPAHPWTPMNVAIAFSDPALDNAAFAAIKKSAGIIQQVAIQEGQSSSDAILYPNYAGPLSDSKLLFGANLPLLQKIQAQTDPFNLVNLTTGFKFH